MSGEVIPYRSVYAYPWDIVPDFERVITEQGLSSVTLGLSYHAGKFIRTRSGQSRVYFPDDGVVYFDPTPGTYGKIKPIPHPDSSIRGVVTQFSERSELALSAWVVLFHNTRLGMLYPDETVRNAWGDAYPYSLCPANPNVADYAFKLVGDIANRVRLSSIVLETPGFLPYAHGFHHEFAQVQSNRWLESLLGLCFCESCLKESQRDTGIDSRNLQLHVRNLVDHYLESPAEISAEMAAAWVAADIIGHSELSAFIRWRMDLVTKLIRQIRTELATGVALAVIPTIQRPTASTWIEGSDLRRLAEAADYLEVPLYEPSASAAIADAWDTLRRSGGDSSKIRAILRPGYPDLAAGEQFQTAIEGIAKLGIRDFAFYNWGLLRKNDFARIGPALRVLEMERSTRQ